MTSLNSNQATRIFEHPRQNFTEFIHFVYNAAVIKRSAIIRKQFQSSLFGDYIHMSSIVTAVFKATIGMLVNKGRDKAADKLKHGDVTHQNFRRLIVREIDEISKKLDGLSRKDLLSSISFFEEGIELLYKVFDQARSKSGNGAAKAQAHCAGDCAEAFSLAEGMRSLDVTDLDKSATRALSDAKKRFEDARRKATEAFNNDALETPDRILAMQYRVMATILEKVDYPEDALEPCRVCIKELNTLKAVQNSFQVQLTEGIRAVRTFVGKDERRKIISGVCLVNRVIYDVTQTVGKDISFWDSPSVDTGEERVDPLRDGRVSKVLRKQFKEHCCVTWSLGQEGEEEYKLKKPNGIATNSRGEFIVGDNGDSDVKVFDSSGTFIKRLSLPNDDLETKLDVHDVATNMNDNIYVKVGLKKPGAARGKSAVYEFNNTSDLHHKFSVREDWNSMTVTDSGKLLVMRRDEVVLKSGNVVDVYETDGQFVYSFGKDILKYAYDITAANDGRVIVVDREDCCVHIFSEHGDHLNKFKLQGCYFDPKIAFHRASEHVVVASVDLGKDLLHVEIYTKDGEFVRSTQIHEERVFCLRGITVTTEGRIAVVCIYRYSSNLPPKVLLM